MADKKEEKIKVNDRRHHSPDSKKSKEQSTEGEGFVMKEGESFEESALDFSTLLLSLATGALINLGLSPDPLTKKTQKNLALAKQNIDILEMLRKKTKGNLTEEENTLFENLLTEVRLRFVEASRK